MPPLSSFWAIALIMTSLLGSALTFRTPVDETFKRKSRFEVREKLTKKDLVCVDDDISYSFHEFSNETIPFCRTFIDVGEQSTTSTVTTATTIVALTTTTETSEAVAIIASSTVTTTITAAPIAPIRKRQQAPIPASQIISSCQLSGPNASLISAVQNACSCLFITEETVTLSETTTSTRTEQGTDYAFATETTTLTSGVATFTVTVLSVAPNTTYSPFTTGAAPSFSPTTLASVTLPPSANTTVAGGSFLPGFPSYSGAPRGGSDITSATQSIASGSAVPFSAFNTTSAYPVSSAASSITTATISESALPSPSINTTSIDLGSSGAPSTTAVTIPSFSVNTTGTISGSIGLPGFPTNSGAPRAGTAESPTPSAVLPPSSVNTTAPIIGSSGSPSSPTGASSGVPVSAANTTFPAFYSPSAAPTTPTNGSSPTTSGSAASSTASVNIGCPIKNGTEYTTNGQTFLILCDTNFVGPDYQGLYVPSLYDCINDCAIVNVGFSQNNCYAASYLPNNGVGSDCFFRTQNASSQPEFDPKATSAILINNTLSSNISASVVPVVSASASPTNSLNSSYPTGPTAYPSATNTSSPYQSTVYENATSLASSTPTPSANLTAVSSAFPTLSINSSYIPNYTGPTGDNRSGGIVSATGGASSAFPPSPTANTTCGWGSTITVTDPGVTLTLTVTASGSDTTQSSSP